MEHYLREAIKTRESRRAYQRLPLRKEDSDVIQALLSRYNAEAKLSFSLIEIDEELFTNYRRGKSSYKNIVNYVALSAAQGSDEKIGYYGELVMLEATAIGLGTCWITRTYDKAACAQKLDLGEGESLYGIIAIGYPSNKKTLREKATKLMWQLGAAFSKPLKSIGEFAPEWAHEGMKCVSRSPSRLPRQPYTFVFTEEGRVKAMPTNASRRIELGIALVHFEIGAAVGRWYKEDGVWTFAVSQS
ncbi:MAG: nitroreductase family protein [Eubacteriaceae bacterium]|nr:nitroreductase family protein [Eubacteriaceae bacterium]